MGLEVVNLAIKGAYVLIDQGSVRGQQKGRIDVLNDIVEVLVSDLSEYFLASNRFLLFDQRGYEVVQ